MPELPQQGQFDGQPIGEAIGVAIGVATSGVTRIFGDRNVEVSQPETHPSTNQKRPRDSDVSNNTDLGLGRSVHPAKRVGAHVGDSEVQAMEPPSVLAGLPLLQDLKRKKQARDKRDFVVPASFIRAMMQPIMNLDNGPANPEDESSYSQDNNAYGSDKRLTDEHPSPEVENDSGHGETEAHMVVDNCLDEESKSDLGCRAAYIRTRFIPRLSRSLWRQHSGSKTRVIDALWQK